MKFLVTGLYRYTKHTVPLRELLGAKDTSQFIEHFPSMHEAMESNPQYHIKRVCS